VLLRINWFKHLTHGKLLPLVFVDPRNLFETVVKRLRLVAASTQIASRIGGADGT
jgi:hypothetical protein